MRMKPSRALAVFVVVFALLAGLWWLARNAPHSAGENAAVVPPAMLTKPLVPKAPNHLSPSITVPSPKPVSDKSAVAVVKKVADPQADLKTAIPDIVRLMRANDHVTYLKIYSEPQFADPEAFERGQANLDRMAAENPTAARIMFDVEREMQRMWESFQYETPTFNDVGDEATYQFVSESSGRPGSVTLIKIDGKWYVKGLGEPGEPP